MRVTPDDILHGPISPVLRRMTLPMVYGIAAMFLFQTADMLFISMLGTQELAAISFTVPVTYTITSLTLGLNIALSITVGKAIGSGRRNTAARITTHAMLVGIIIVTLIGSVGLATVDPLFTALGASAATIVLIHEYIDLWYLFAGFLVLPYLATSAIRATGDTKWPSILMVAAGAVNIILDPFLIFGYGPFPAMGIRGAAVATVISWALSFLASLWLLGKREQLITIKLPGIAALVQDARELFRLGVPISLANMAVPIGVAILTRFVSQYGEQAVAAFGAGSRIEGFAMVASFALTAALSPYMAQNFGANNPQRAKQALAVALRAGFIIQLVIVVVLLLTSGLIGQMFSNDPEVIRTIQHFLWIMPIGGAFYAIFIIYNTAYNASGRSNLTLYATLVRLFALLLPLAWLGQKYFGLIGLFVGVVVANVLAAWVSAIIYRRKLATDGDINAPSAAAIIDEP